MSSTPPSSSDATPTVDDFLRTVLRSGLLGRAELQAALRDVPRGQREDPSCLAEHLIHAGKLSRFQAAKLLKGTALGLVLGPYQVLAPIGKGGMSTVYLCRDERTQQLLALKVLPPRKARLENRMLVRFQREMKMSQLVGHPHVAWTCEVGAYRGVHYIAMEYIPGKTLSRVVADQGPLEVPRAARLMAEVASGLHHAHDQGLIHRDLKPSNILVTPRDHAKVLDLGLALLDGETGDSRIVGGQGYILGTMDYIAPEQTTDAAAVDRRSDLYSLGCTLYYALSGQPPFPGGTSRDKIMHHRQDQPPSLASLRPGLPPAFVALVERLMAKEPGLRPPTAAAAEEELRAWAGGPVLPLDAPTDSSYAASVAALQEASPSPSEEIVTLLPAEEEEVRLRKGVPLWVVLALVGSVSALGALAAVGGLLVWWLGR